MVSGPILRRSSLLASLILGVSLPLAAPAQPISQAQNVSQIQTISQAQLRAANLARMEAERLNGGLTKYFAGQCMHQRGGANCLIQANEKGVLFRFPGGTPGWEANRRAATVESQILISADGKRIEKVAYNGAPRTR
jgi:hypothetical protein